MRDYFVGHVVCLSSVQFGLPLTRRNSFQCTFGKIYVFCMHVLCMLSKTQRVDLIVFWALLFSPVQFAGTHRRDRKFHTDSCSLHSAHSVDFPTAKLQPKISLQSSFLRGEMEERRGPQVQQFLHFWTLCLAYQNKFCGPYPYLYNHHYRGYMVL